MNQENCPLSIKEIHNFYKNNLGERIRNEQNNLDGQVS